MKEWSRAKINASNEKEHGLRFPKITRNLNILELHSLRKGRRYRLPACMVTAIRENYPSISGQYAGFKDLDNNAITSETLKCFWFISRINNSFNAKLKILKIEKFWQGPRTWGSQNFSIFYFQLCIERFFDSTTPKQNTSTLINPIRRLIFITHHVFLLPTMDT